MSHFIPLWVVKFDNWCMALLYSMFHLRFLSTSTQVHHWLLLLSKLHTRAHAHFISWPVETLSGLIIQYVKYTVSLPLVNKWYHLFSSTHHGCLITSTVLYFMSTVLKNVLLVVKMCTDYCQFSKQVITCITFVEK